MKAREVIEKYIESNRNAWSHTTLRSERSRLLSQAEALFQEPEKVFEKLKGTRSPYGLKTLFIRLSNVCQFAVENNLMEVNKYERFLKTNRNAFKHVYRRKEVHLSYEQAKAAINRIKDQAAKRHAEVLLNSGCRISESYSISVDDRVTGKGGKQRKVFNVPKDFQPTSQSKLRRELQKVGLRPHDLRKLAATRASENGARPEDLCALFGWSSIATAYHYLQPRREDELAGLLT